MEKAIGLIILLAVIAVALFLARKRQHPLYYLVADLIRRREAKLTQLLEYLDEHESITNQHARTLLGVSDATMTRYFDILERRGQLKQVGKAGKWVTYKID